MIYVMLMTTVHIKPMKHPPFAYKTWDEAKETVEDALRKGYLYQEDVFITLGEGAAIHIASEAAMTRAREKGFVIKDWNVLVCPLNAPPLPPFPCEDREKAESAVRCAIQSIPGLGRLRSQSVEEDEFQYIHAPGTIYLILSREECIKRLTSSGNNAGGSRIIQ